MQMIKLTGNLKLSTLNNYDCSHNYYFSSIRSKLIEYLNSKIPPLIPIKKETDNERKSHMSNFFNNTGSDYCTSTKLVRPKKTQKTWRRRNAKCQQKGNYFNMVIN